MDLNGHGHCCEGQQHRNSNRFTLSSVLQLRTLLCVCRALICMCGHDVSTYALCVLRLRVCVCAGLSV